MKRVRVIVVIAVASLVVAQNPEADWAEAEQGKYRVEVTFSGNTVLSEEELGGTFGVRSGDPFEVAKIRDGLERLRIAYRRRGYVNFTPVPDSRIDHEGRTVLIAIQLDEGPQFLFGPVEIIGGKKEHTARLRKEMESRVGKPFDVDWYNRIVTNRKLLPPCARWAPIVDAENARYAMRINLLECS